MIQKNFITSSVALRASRWEFLWLCGLILSFAYERPVWCPTSYDRVNLRLFDVMSFVGILILRPNLRPNLRRGVCIPKVLRIWAAIVAVFCFCALIWAIALLPWEYGKFSLFFAAKYVQGLIAIYIASTIPLDVRQKRIIHYMVVAGGVFVALYSIGQYGSGQTDWAISGGKSVTSNVGVIYGPLSRSYFHVGMFSVLSFAMTLALVSATRCVDSWLWLCVAFFVAWPALVCGSRAAMAGIAIVILTSVFLRPKLIGQISLLAVMVVLLLFVLDVNIKDTHLDETSLGYKRFQDYRDYNSLLSRIMLRFSIKQYMWDGLPVPFIGAGFYVAPVDDGTGAYHYRVGYGIHNSYLFPLEQGGMIAFVLFLLFLACAIRHLNQRRKSILSVDSQFALGFCGYMAFMLANGFAGQGFWRGFDTANFNTYVVLLLMIAAMGAAEPNALINPTR